MAKKAKKEVKLVVKSAELKGAIVGKVLNDSGIVGDGCLVK